MPILLGIMLIAMLYAMTHQPKQQSPNPAGLGDLQLPTAESGRPIPIVFGTVRIQGSNIVWFGDLGSTRIYADSGK